MSVYFTGVDGCKQFNKGYPYGFFCNNPSPSRAHDYFPRSVHPESSKNCDTASPASACPFSVQ